ncbi:MAG: hypothetical protein JO202_18385 [Ktedonobacteraceae bacterium]|nr:hypothetical protein [Ktedonobacteraceae bacterium]
MDENAMTGPDELEAVQDEEQPAQQAVPIVVPERRPHVWGWFDWLVGWSDRFFGLRAASAAPSRGVVSGAPSAGDAPFYEDDILIPPLPSPRLTTSEMSQEQLKRRRINLIENAKFGRPLHETVMLVLLRIWLLAGPMLFVALTTSEVAYILTRLVPPNDTGDLIITVGALFIDIAMMFTTFGVAIKRRDLAEKRDAFGAVPKRDEMEVLWGTLMWLTFAVINIIGQTAFLLHIIAQGHDPNTRLLYVFVASRVIGFILGDACTAFFLAKVDTSHIKLIARAEREKAHLYHEIASAEGERRLVEAKAEADILLVNLEVKRKEDEANFLAELQRQVFSEVLTRRTTTPEVEGPNRSKVRRLDM